jgi:uncharacterized small protein (DUF1192 family)
MAGQQEVDELVRRIAELEAELAQAKAAHQQLLQDEVKADKNWGEFNPG